MVKAALSMFFMQAARSRFAANPKLFGKGPVRDLSRSEIQRTSFTNDFKLFATTFLAGFLFVSILIG
jgi:hypothetical protein